MEHFFNAFLSGYHELLEYLDLHLLTCLVPAFFIAGGIAVAVSSAAVLKYFGPATKKCVSYGVASVSGTVLAVCSCTILPLFAGIYRKGSGIGPAITFLYAGPAINLLAIVFTARLLGFELGVARAVGAVLFSIVIGLVMAVLYRREEAARAEAVAAGEGFNPAAGTAAGKSLTSTLVFLGPLVAVLLAGSLHLSLFTYLAVLAVLLAILVIVLKLWFTGDEVREWLRETYTLGRLIVPILLVGVFLAGALKYAVPHAWVAGYVGGNSLSANLIAAMIGALMYFSTLTEVPIIKALTEMGMGKGPALALLLAGPALSLPNMLVIRKIIGTQKALVYIGLVVLAATATGMLFGSLR